MVRALILLLALTGYALPARAQTASCDASEVRFDFSDPGALQSITVAGSPYYVANLAGYLQLLSGNGSMRFLPTQVIGGNGVRVSCTLTTPNGGGGGGTLCGSGTNRCFRVSGVSGSLPLPGNWNQRLYVQVQVVSGAASSLVPSPTLLSQVPDTRGLANVARKTAALLYIYYWVELSPSDAFAALPAQGSLTLTYALQNN